jgi:hypothetical protein
MSVVNEIPLPGIGVRYEFVTVEGIGSRWSNTVRRA